MSFRVRINKWSGFYAFGYILVASGIRGYFRRFEVHGKENVPLDKPVLFAPNHQNAFIDGAIVGYAILRPTYYLGRADIFERKLANYVLRGFNCLPIYRERDGADYRQKNVEVFETFYELLAEKNRINIFPEGSHGKYKEIRGPLKKGVFRIGVGAENHFNRSLDVHVVPVGIDYERHSVIGGNLLVNFGQPIRILDHISDDDDEQERIYTKLVEELESRLDSVMINIREKEHYDLIRNMMLIFETEIGIRENRKGNTLIAKFRTEKQFVSRMEQWIDENRKKAVEYSETERSFSDGTKGLRIRPWLFSKERHKTGWRLLFLIALFPLFLFGVVNSFLPFMIPQWRVRTKIKDVHFHTSIKVIFGALLFLVFWTAQTIIVAQWFGFPYWLGYLILLPVTGWVAYRWWINFLKFNGILRYRRYAKNEIGPFLTLRRNYTRLYALLDTVYHNKKTRTERFKSE